MRALGIQQPWAYTILPTGLVVAGVGGQVEGPKCIENRTWGEGFVGPLLVLASRSLSRDTKDLRAWFAEYLPEFVLPAKGTYPTGCIVGAVYVATTTRSSGHAMSSTGRPGGGADQAKFCDCLAGTVYWAMKDKVVFERPIPWRGELKLFDVPLRVVEDQLAGWKWLGVAREREGMR
ncbi:MAG: hypothetical protein ACREJO_03515 [Phycisphaerales bacterium]